MRRVSPIRATLMTRIDLTGDTPQDSIHHRGQPCHAVPRVRAVLQASERIAITAGRAVLAPAMFGGNGVACRRIEHLRKARKARIVAVQRAGKAPLDQAALGRATSEVVKKYERGL